MNTGKPSEPKLEPILDEAVPEALKQYASWLLADPRTLEVWGLLEARLAKVECIAADKQSLELDSGDWFLVRVCTRGLPTTPGTPLLPTTPATNGIIRFRRGVGKKESQAL